MAEERVEPKPIDLGNINLDFTMTFNLFSTGKGLNEAVIRELSAAKMQNGMLEFVWNLLKPFKRMPMQNLG